MCTVVIEVAEPDASRPARFGGVDDSQRTVVGAHREAGGASGEGNPPVAETRILAVRDEDPGRAWDAPGRWWPEHPDIIGVRDRLAGGGWLAVNPTAGRFAVLLNRAPGADAPRAASTPPTSRGVLAIGSVTGQVLADPPPTAPFNLVEVTSAGATLTSWDGVTVRRRTIKPGVHMIAHHELDDVAHSPRIAAWLPEFQRHAGLPAPDWRDAWVEVLARSASLGPHDDRAIVRDNRVHGYPTESLLVCLAEAPAVALEHAVLTEPGVWGEPVFVRDV